MAQRCSTCVGADGDASRVLAAIGSSPGMEVERSARQQHREADGFSEQVGAPGVVAVCATGFAWQEGTAAFGAGFAAARAAVHSAKQGDRLESNSTAHTAMTPRVDVGFWSCAAIYKE